MENHVHVRVHNIHECMHQFLLQVFVCFVCFLRIVCFRNLSLVQCFNNKEATAAIPAKAAAAQVSEFIEAPLSFESSPDPQHSGVTTSTNIVATVMTVAVNKVA